jgi:hypothetical protein
MDVNQIKPRHTAHNKKGVIKMNYTDYKTAATWGNCQLILCNNLPEIDSSVWDNMRWDLMDEEGNSEEIFQWYITDLSDWQVSWNEKNF